MDRQRNEHRAVVTWLIACCTLVFAMVVLGGLTRLTHSGLSIVEWQPVVGTLPPMNDAQWQEMFAKYRATPEYLKVNAGMSLAEFKGIFWLEYFHRLLGRVIGLAFFVPFVYFLARRRLGRTLTVKLAVIFALGALQGVVGWLMVKSGLVDDPRVSAHRLALHLGLAFVIYAAMLWTVLDLLEARAAPRDDAPRAGLRRLALAITGVIALLVVTGAFVAGIRAGLAYNTFPLMHSYVVPPDIFVLDPWWDNFFNNMGLVQFNHRLMAWLLAILVAAFWLAAWRGGAGRRVQLLAHALLAAFAVQAALGIATLLLAVPVALGVAHQGFAVVVFTVALVLNHALRARPVARRAERDLAARSAAAPAIAPTAKSAASP